MNHINFDQMDVKVNHFWMPVAIFLLSIFDIFVFLFLNGKDVMTHMVTIHIFVAVLIVVIEGIIGGKMINEYNNRNKKWKRLIHAAKSINCKTQQNGLTQICKLLSLNDQNLTNFFVENGVVAALVKCLSSDEDSVKSKALNGLQTISAGSPTQVQAIVEEDAVSQLVEVLSESNSFIITQHALTILLNLAKLGSEVREQCIGSEILSKLEKFVECSAWMEHASTTAELLSCLFSNPDLFLPKDDCAELSSLVSKLLVNHDKTVSKCVSQKLSEIIKNTTDSPQVIQNSDILETVFTPDNIDIFETVFTPDNVNQCTENVSKAPVQSVDKEEKNDIANMCSLNSKLLTLSSSEESVATDDTQDLECSSDDEKESDMYESTLTVGSDNFAKMPSIALHVLSSHFRNHSFTEESFTTNSSQNDGRQNVDENDTFGSVVSFNPDVIFKNCDNGAPLCLLNSKLLISSSEESVATQNPSSDSKKDPDMFGSVLTFDPNLLFGTPQNINDIRLPLLDPKCLNSSSSEGSLLSDGFRTIGDDSDSFGSHSTLESDAFVEKSDHPENADDIVDDELGDFVESESNRFLNGSVKIHPEDAHSIKSEVLIKIDSDGDSITDLAESTSDNKAVTIFRLL